MSFSSPKGAETFLPFTGICVHLISIVGHKDQIDKKEEINGPNQ